MKLDRLIEKLTQIRSAICCDTNVLIRNCSEFKIHSGGYLTGDTETGDFEFELDCDKDLIIKVS